MSKNIHSSDSMGEDIIRTFVQLGCGEAHLKTLLEKANGELDEGIVDIDDPEAVNAKLREIDEITEEIEEVAQLRRRTMLTLFSMYASGDEKEDEKRKSYWCQVKHLGIASYTIFEAYQASDNDPDLYALSLEVNKQFIRALTHFLGKEITTCAACFGDMMKGEK